MFENVSDLYQTNWNEYNISSKQSLDIIPNGSEPQVFSQEHHHYLDEVLHSRRMDVLRGVLQSVQKGREGRCDHMQHGNTCRHGRWTWKG